MPIRPRLALVAAAVLAALVSGVQGARRQRRRPAVPARHAAVRRDALSRGARGVSQGRRRRLQVASPSRRASASSSRRCGSASSSRPRRKRKTLKQQEPQQRRGRSPCTPTRCGRPACSTRPHQEFKDALALVPDLSRGHHGLARALASQNKLDEALNEAQAALKLSPRDEEIHHTVGSIFERMRRYEQAAAAYGNYVNLLPNKDRSDKAAWSRSQIRFLRSFGEREPIAMDEARGGRPAHRRFPRRRRQGDRQGARQRRPPAGLRARYRLGADDDFAADGVERRSCARSPTR